VFLDELTTGLDPQARARSGSWCAASAPRQDRVLTTHLMEEAERLCDRVAIIEHGASSTSTRRAAGRAHCPERTVVIATDDPLPRIASRHPARRAVTPRRPITIRGRGEDFVTDVIQCLSEHRIRVTDFRTVLPTLEDVFLTSPATRFGTEASDAAWTAEADVARDQDLPARAAGRARDDPDSGGDLRRLGGSPRQPARDASPTERSVRSTCRSSPRADRDQRRAVAGHDHLDSTARAASSSGCARRRCVRRRSCRARARQAAAHAP
jgi:hypothetical protein